MAAVCGSSLALFDAGKQFLCTHAHMIFIKLYCKGVPMSKPAAGVACGLMLDLESGGTDYVILSDLSVSYCTHSVCVSRCVCVSFIVGY